MKCPEISKRMTYILNLRGLRAQDLSDKTGINKASISQYVNGSHSPSNEKAQLMADVLKVNPLWLMGFDVPMLEERLMKCLELYSGLSEENQKIVDQMIEALSKQ